MSNQPASGSLPKRAHVQTVRNAQSTEYVITGALNDVFAAIETLLYEYGPQGYGTRCNGIAMKDFGPEYVARMSRANSCG